MPKNTETLPTPFSSEINGNPETGVPLTGESLRELLNQRWEMLELNPYTDKETMIAGPAQIAYDEVLSQIENNRPLTEAQEYVFKYLAAESSLLHTQVLVDSRIVKDKDKFEAAVREAYENLVETQEDDSTNLSDEDIEELDDHIHQLSIVLDRLEEGEELPDGKELLEYLNFTEFARAWENQDFVKFDTDPANEHKIEWMEAAKQEKLHAVEKAIEVLEAEWRTYLMLSENYQSRLVDEASNEQQEQ